jgi:hypothetical protein
MDKTFIVTINALANVSQSIQVKASSKEEAEEKVLSDEHDTYYGNHVWKYNGLYDSNSMDIVVHERN